MNILLNTMFIAIFLILVLALIIGLVSSKLVLIWNYKPIRLQVVGWLLLALFAYLMIFGIRLHRKDAKLPQEDAIYSNTEAEQTIIPEPVQSNPDFNGLPVKITIEDKDYLFHDFKVSKIGDEIYITAYTKSDVSYSLGSHSSRGDFPIWCVYLGDAQYWTSYVELKQTDIPNEIAFVYGPFSFSNVKEIILFEKERTANQRGVTYNGEYK